MFQTSQCQTAQVKTWLGPWNTVRYCNSDMSSKLPLKELSAAPLEACMQHQPSTCAAGKFPRAWSIPQSHQRLSCSCSSGLVCGHPSRYVRVSLLTRFNYPMGACRVFNDQIYYTCREIRLPFHEVKRQSWLLIELFVCHQDRLCVSATVSVGRKRLGRPPSRAFPHGCWKICHWLKIPLHSLLQGRSFLSYALISSTDNKVQNSELPSWVIWAGWEQSCVCVWGGLKDGDYGWEIREGGKEGWKPVLQLFFFCFTSARLSLIV